MWYYLEETFPSSKLISQTQTMMAIPLKNGFQNPLAELAVAPPLADR